MSFQQGRYIENVDQRIGQNGFPLWLFQINSYVYMTYNHHETQVQVQTLFNNKNER